ncbi:MAG: carbohydrate porin [Fusobacteriaceae bacterium]
MNKKLLALMGCVLIAGSAIAAEDNGGYEFHGYGRSGAVWDGVNKAQGFPREFQYNWTDENGVARTKYLSPAVGKEMVGRLGIENDTYWDMGITKNFKMDDGAWGKVTVMVGQYAGTTWESNLDGVQGKQIFAEIGGGSMLGDASVWAGKRYYNRRDIHVNDMFYTDYSGTGGGIDNIKTSFGTFSLGVVGRDYNDYDLTTTRDDSFSTALLNYKIAGFDIDLATSKAQGTIPVEPVGTAKPSNYVAETDIGFQTTVQYNLDSFYFLGNGFANTFVQYGSGLSSGAGLGQSVGMVNVTSSSSSIRFGTYGLAALNDSWDLFTSIWGRMDNNLGDYNSKGDSNTSFSIVARPIYAINKNFELQFEAGYGMFINGLSDSQNKSNSTAQENGLPATYKEVTTSAYKLSLAPTFKLDTTNFFARPEVRFFVTYTGYTNNATKDPDKNYSTETAMTGMGNAEVTTGVQMEMWF